jgi:uncharacterized protein YciI
VVAHAEVVEPGRVGQLREPAHVPATQVRGHEADAGRWHGDSIAYRGALGSVPVKYVVRYETNPDELGKAVELFDAHKARWSEYADAGTLLAIGPFSDPTKGALGVFTTREAAEGFVTGDPFVLEGVVASWEVLEWNEVLLP